MPNPITIGDIAKQTGVSKTTVSRILNGKPDVSPETRERVLQTIQEMGFVPNALARSLSRGHSNMVGIMVPSLSNTWTLELLRGVSTAIEQSPYNLVLFSAATPTAAQDFFDTTLPMGLLAGLILVLPPPRSSQIKRLLASDFPVILLDDHGNYPDYNSISVTNHQGAYQATRHLLDLGHTRIAYLSGPTSARFFRERKDGYLQAMAEAGVTTEKELVVECEATKENGAAVVEDWLKKTPPTAIFASIDLMTYGVLEMLRIHGIHVPDDIALVGFDDLPASEFLQPPLTTVKEPTELIGQTASKMLLEWIQSGIPAQKNVEIKTDLIVRVSCGAKLQVENFKP